jgi:hypothetical protein
VKKPAAIVSLILTPLSVTVLVASCNPGTPSGGDGGRTDAHHDANADAPLSCNPPPDYANCSSCVETNCGGALQSICAGFENAYCGCIDHPEDAGRDAGRTSSPTVAQCVRSAANASCKSATRTCVLNSCLCQCSGGCDGGMDSGPDAPTDAPTDVGVDAMSCVNSFFTVLEGNGPACPACLDSSCSSDMSAFASACSAGLSCACRGGVFSVDAGDSAICTADFNESGCLYALHVIQGCAATNCVPSGACK